jgi:hypothetical protein
MEVMRGICGAAVAWEGVGGICLSQFQVVTYGFVAIVQPIAALRQARSSAEEDSLISVYPECSVVFHISPPYLGS